MAAIKRFFEKRKLDVKFKRAGEGHKLSESARTSSEGSRACTRAAPVPRPSAGPSHEARMAASAALNRAHQDAPGSESTSAKSIKRQVKKELEAERLAHQKAQADAETYSAPKEVDIECSPHLAVTGVFFRCPMIGPVVLQKQDMENQIKLFLVANLTDEPEMTSSLMIHTLNKDKEKVKVCIETLCKYLDNIIQHPEEDKYRKIRFNNKAFQERIFPMQGSQEFLQAAGFSVQTIKGPNEVDEDFYVMTEEAALDLDRLASLKDILVTGEPIKPEIDRNLKVFNASAHASRMEVPDDFYAINPEELKKEQNRRQEAVERLGMLRTKEMREREKMRELRRYRYTVLRIRFPTGIFLQGTFKAIEKIEAVFSFIRENLENDWMPFTLSTQTGHQLSDEDDATLVELGLAPASLINFQWDPTIAQEFAVHQGGAQPETLKGDIMAQIQDLE